MKCKKFIYSNGLNISQTRKLCEYVFKDFLVKVHSNELLKIFEIYIQDKIKHNNEIKTLDKKYVKDFIDFWNKDFQKGHPKKEGKFKIIILSEKKFKL